MQTYLLAKLASLTALGDGNDTQKAIICTWLTEIYLNELNKLQDDNRADRLAALLDEFKQFLTDNVDNMRRSIPTIQNLISSHGRVEALLCFASLVGKNDLVISHYIQRKEYENALATLSEQRDPKLYAKFAPTLMFNMPMHTVNALMRATFLNPRDAIPALMRYDPTNPVARRLEPEAVVRVLCLVNNATCDFFLILYCLLPWSIAK